MSKVHRISLFLIILLSIFVCWYTTRNVQLDLLIKELSSSNLFWIMVALGCMLFYLLLEALIINILVETSYTDFTFKDAVKIPLVEQLFNAITPFSSGGQPAQLVALINDGVDGGKAASMLLMKFVVFQAMIVLNCFIGLIVGFKYVVGQMNTLAWFLLFGFLIHLGVISFLLLTMYHYAFAKKLVDTLIIPLKWFLSPQKFTNIKVKLGKQMQEFHQESLYLAHDKKLIFKISVITFFQLLIYYLIPYFIMLALGCHGVNIIMVVCLNILIVMGISLFPIPGGTGGAEYSFEAIFKTYIPNQDTLVLALLIWRFITYYLGIILGLWSLTLKPQRVKPKN